MNDKTRPFYIRKPYHIDADLAERVTPVLIRQEICVEIVHESGLKEVINIKDKTDTDHRLQMGEVSHD